MSDPLAIAAAERHLRTAETEITTALQQLGIHQFHDALTEHPLLQDAIVQAQEALMSLEQALGFVGQATSLIDHEIEMGLRKAA